MSHDHLDWPRLSYREQFREKDEETDRGNDRKTTSKSALALNGISYYGKLRTARSGGSWLKNLQWCPNGQPDYGIGEGEGEERYGYLKAIVGWLVGCLTSQQRASVYQGRICSYNFTCCHTETEVVDQIVHLTQSRYTDTGPTSPSTDSMTPDAWQGSHWSGNFF